MYLHVLVCHAYACISMRLYDYATSPPFKIEIDAATFISIQFNSKLKLIDCLFLFHSPSLPLFSNFLFHFNFISCFRFRGKSLGNSEQKINEEKLLLQTM